jgi:hypothetical protein
LVIPQSRQDFPESHPTDIRFQTAVKNFVEAGKAMHVVRYGTAALIGPPGDKFTGSSPERQAEHDAESGGGQNLQC